MSYTPQAISAQLDRLLPQVQRPGRYTGGELNQVVKDWGQVQTKVCFAFPDIYDIGMSNYGLMILYDIINCRADALAERVYCPWSDMETLLRSQGLPLYSLESKQPLAQFDIVAISIPYETLYTNTLNLLDLGGIPIFSADRTQDHPLVIAGGHAMFNPEPMHAFLDAVVIGEGEEVINEIVDHYQQWKDSGGSRQELLQMLSNIWGVYVPALYQAEYTPDGSLIGIKKLYEKAQLPIVKRIVPVLPPPTTNLIVPYIDTVQNRIPVEIMRGCTRGCRFCHAGMITRPLRERPVEQIITAIKEGMDKTGFEEVGLLSLSSSDYSYALELVKEVGLQFGERALSISLPSLRIESFSVELMDALQDTRRSGFTLAPEAATEKIRNIINKPVSNQQLMQTAKHIYSRGWTNIKLYFMIGHPEEGIQDVQGIADLCKQVLFIGRDLIGYKANVTASISTFIPKPHTPFQWETVDNLVNIHTKQELLKGQLRGPGLKVNWNHPNETMLEAALSCGDRRLSAVIYAAWQMGAKFDAWHEHFDWARWLQAFTQVGLDPGDYTHRQRHIDEVLPWDHINSGISKAFLAQDHLMSKRGKSRVDCRQHCYSCGILSTFNDLRKEHPDEVWQCPEVEATRSSQKITQS